MQDIMLIAHGALNSTIDIYKYFAHDMDTNEEINLHRFPYHKAMEYHNAAISVINPEMETGARTYKSVVAAAREIVTDIVLTQPKHVIFIGGLAVPIHIAGTVYNLRKGLTHQYSVGYIFTESPYQDEEQEQYMPFLDYAFFNDLYSAEKYNPDGELFVSYLPHSYSNSVHFPFRSNIEYESDALFCGTLYENRVEFFNSIDWKDVDKKFVGVYSNNNVRLNFDITEGICNNVQLAEMYRKSKLSINFHRDSGSVAAYSMNPRIRESVMCGCLPISDYRKEIEDVFGDIIPFADNSYEVESEMKRLLQNDPERENRVRAAQVKIASHSYKDRLNQIILPTLQEVEAVLWGKS